VRKIATGLLIIGVGAAILGGYEGIALAVGGSNGEVATGTGDVAPCGPEGQVGVVSQVDGKEKCTLVGGPPSRGVLG
jgi:hypothetical protein